MTTISDVAREANVSNSTVSQYLNRRYEYMSNSTKIRIEESISKLNYIPNYIGRSLRQKQTSMVGVIVANILHTFSTKITRAIEDLCNEQGIHVILCNADDDPRKERRYIEMLRSRQVDGLFVFPTSGNHDLYNSMVDKGFPLVFIDRYISNLNIDTVLLDNFDATTQAVEHLKGKGYEHLGFLTTTLNGKVVPRIERIEGFQVALKEQKLPVQNGWINGVALAKMQQYLNDLFTKRQRPEALLAGNDLTLMEILKFVKQKKYSIPNDVALIGIDHIPFADFFTPRLTTIVQPIEEMAEIAFDLLNQNMKQHKHERQIIRVKPFLIDGCSC